jgi:hypothetical protein
MPPNEKIKNILNKKYINFRIFINEETKVKKFLKALLFVITSIEF